METVAAKFGPKENTAFIRKVIEFFKIPEQSYPYVSHHVSNCSESKQYFSLNLITYDQAVADCCYFTLFVESLSQLVALN